MYAKAQTEAFIAAERAAFEQWQSEYCGQTHFCRDPDGLYSDFALEGQWQGWFARALMED